MSVQFTLLITRFRVEEAKPLEQIESSLSGSFPEQCTDVNLRVVSLFVNKLMTGQARRNPYHSLDDRDVLSNMSATTCSVLLSPSLPTAGKKTSVRPSLSPDQETSQGGTVNAHRTGWCH